MCRVDEGGWWVGGCEGKALVKMTNMKQFFSTCLIRENTFSFLIVYFSYCYCVFFSIMNSHMNGNISTHSLKKKLHVKKQMTVNKC